MVSKLVITANLLQLQFIDYTHNAAKPNKELQAARENQCKPT